jgi:pantoate--beta-alanine ligase
VQVVESVAELRATLGPTRRGGRSIGLVSTMGSLHAGHLRLAEEAARENDLVVMSIFVNPAQFGPGEDFERYPRDIGGDRRLAKASRSIDVLFLPSVEEMYPGGPKNQRFWIDPGVLGEILEGASRPGHFRGVATVVAKLFNMVEPTQAYFGQKDAQQAIVVQWMVHDLAFPVKIRVIPTVRDADLVAISSRNVYLTQEERAEAPALHAALSWAEKAVREGLVDAPTLDSEVRREIEQRAPSARIDYVAVVDPATMEPIKGAIVNRALVVLAVYFGHTRLIDNVVVDVSHEL